jgi:plastocyanin
MRTGRLAAAAVALALFAACGSQPSSGPSPADNPNRVTISAAGVLTPSQITIAPGARVLFVNNHSHSHQITSDPHPEHTDCPEINQVGLLAQGQQRETGNFVVARTCGLHDHDDPDNQSLRGRIIIR